MADEHDLITETLDSGEAGGRLIRGGAVRILTYGLSLLASLVSAPLVIRHLGKPDYGYFATVTAITYIVSGFTEGGLNALGLREYAAGRADRGQLLRNLVGLRVTATAFGIAVAALGASLLDARQVITEGILVAGAGLIVTITAETYLIPLSAQVRVTAVSVLSLAQQLGLAITYVVLVVTGARVLPLLAATVVSGGVLLLASRPLLKGHVSLIPAFDLDRWRVIARQTLPYAAAAAVGTIYFRETLVLTSALTTGTQASWYAAAFRIVEVITVAPWTLMTAALPILARAAHTDDDDRMGYAQQRLFEVALIAGAGLAGAILTGAHFAIAVVAGPGFGPSVAVLQIQGLAVMTSSLVALFGVVLLSRQMFGALLRANAVAALAVTALALILIPAAGIDGAAIAPTAAEGLLALLYGISLGRERASLRVSLGVAPRAAAALAVALAVTLPLSLPDFVSPLLFLAVYGTGLLALRAVPTEILAALHR